MVIVYLCEVDGEWTTYAEGFAQSIIQTKGGRKKPIPEGLQMYPILLRDSWADLYAAKKMLKSFVDGHSPEYLTRTWRDLWTEYFRWAEADQKTRIKLTRQLYHEVKEKRKVTPKWAECPHCGHRALVPNVYRHHFKNCPNNGDK